MKGGTIKTSGSDIVIYLLFVLVLGFAAGAVVWVFFFVMNLVISLLWGTLPGAIGTAIGTATDAGASAADAGAGAGAGVMWWYAPALCMTGGLLIGWFEKRYGPLPPTLHSVMADVKRDKRYPYDDMGKNAVAALLPLFFGGSIGPEAGLTGVIAGLCSWVSDRMKLAKSALIDLSEVGITATLGAVFNAPLFAFVMPIEDEREEVDSVTFPGRRKLFLNITAIIGSLAAFMVLGSLFGENGGLYRFTDLSITADELYWTIPLIATGVVLGLVYGLSMLVTARYGKALSGHVVGRAVLTGLVLGLIGCILPYAMFSGESQMDVIVEGYGTAAAGLLIATGVVKLFTGPLCINGGWRGGNIFPVIFSGVAVGLGLSLLTGIDMAFSCAVVCGALCGVVMRKPLSVIMLLVLCFPVKALVFVGLAAVIGAAVPLPRRNDASGDAGVLQDADGTTRDVGEEPRDTDGATQVVGEEPRDTDGSDAHRNRNEVADER